MLRRPAENKKLIMPLYRTEAIVIRSHPYGESDRIVTFLSRDFGKIKGIAKGARRSKRRFQNALGLFSHIRLIFFDREGTGLVRADSCDILHAFPKLREDLRKILYGNYFLELMDGMAGERESNREAFDLLLSFLSTLDGAEFKEERLRMFEIRSLALFGYRPGMRGCGLCKRGWEELKEASSGFFSIERGTFICGRCSQGWKDLMPLSLGTARLIERISQMDLAKLERFRFTSLALSETRELLPRFITFQLGRELKSLEALKMIPSEPSGPLRVGKSEGTGFPEGAVDRHVLNGRVKRHF
jgi:DNA repair protein RecO (recombination protein O)